MDCGIYCKWLPSGNADEIDGIKAYCKSNKIPYLFIQFSASGFEFIFRDADKFPQDDDKPFLPVDIGETDGHSISKIHQSVIIDDLTSGRIVAYESYNPNHKEMDSN